MIRRIDNDIKSVAVIESSSETKNFLEVLVEKVRQMNVSKLIDISVRLEGNKVVVYYFIVETYDGFFRRIIIVESEAIVDRKICRSLILCRNELITPPDGSESELFSTITNKVIALGRCSNSFDFACQLVICNYFENNTPSKIFVDACIERFKTIQLEPRDLENGELIIADITSYL